MNSSTTESPARASLQLSVVVASSNHGALLKTCIEALAAQADPATVEIIVARDAERFADVDRSGLASRFPALRWIEAPAGTTVPRLRGLGIAAARGPLVAMIEDDCVVDTGWCRGALASPGHFAALGGAVEPGPYRRRLDWAVYFCEYGRFMLPVPSGGAAPLPGNNVVYAQRALSELPEAGRMDFRDVFIHAAWQAAGVPTGVTGDLVVRNVNSWSPRHVTTVPFHHGRAYAAQRFGARGAAVRTGFAVLAIGLPAVKLLRTIAGTLSRRRLLGQLALALPWMLVFAGSWSAGEILGCLAGPGDSPSRWR